MVKLNDCLSTTGQIDRRGLRLLAASGVPFVVKGAVLPPTKDKMDRFEAWAREATGLDEPPSWATLFDLRSRRDGARDAGLRGWW